MTVERREEITEVVSYNTANVGPVVMGNPTPVATYQAETVTNNSYATRSMQILKIQQAILLLFGILEALLGIRFVLGLLAANPAAGFAQLIYGLTGPFLAPFVGLFGEPNFGGMVFEWNALIAIVVYVLLAGLLVKLVAFTMGNTRNGTYSSTSSRIDSL
ncbi:MAG: YggT family protein [Caldilineaceae bacterium]|nr:YggT family protein [Caldilineaceae bacterium]HRJ41472.1 YggT family protein [Caldilineaceae bacterium]